MNELVYGWDIGNRLRTVTDASPTNTLLGAYVYDPFGRRIAKTDGSGVVTTQFLWDGDQLLAEYDGSGVRQKRYAYAGGFAPVQYATGPAGGETSYDVHADHLGTPRVVTDVGKSVVWRAYYSAFGAASVDSSVTSPPGFEFNIRFPGQYYDAESELHYNRFRYYDPTIGRYISADPIGQFGGEDSNLYRYVVNDPVNLADPMGLRFIGPGGGSRLGRGGGSINSLGGSGRRPGAAGGGSGGGRGGAPSQSGFGGRNSEMQPTGVPARPSGPTTESVGGSPPRFPPARGGKFEANTPGSGPMPSSNFTPARGAIGAAIIAAGGALKALLGTEDPPPIPLSCDPTTASCVNAPQCSVP